MRRARLVLAFALFAVPALAAEGPLFRVYKQYVKAIDDGDLAGAKKHLSTGKLKLLEELSDDEALSEINVISPKEKLRPHKEIIDGDDATLIVLADVAENESVGRIQLAREKGGWKILSEMWNIGGDPDEPLPAPDHQPANDTQREAIRKLREMGYPTPSEDFMAMAAVKGEVEVLKLFVEAGYSADSKSDDGSPAIVNAAMFGQPEAVQYLLQAGADVNAVDGANTTALMRLADKCDSTDVVRELLRAGARTDIKSAGGATAAQLAHWSNCKENEAAIKSAKK